jgi:hypothetical protein
MPYLGIHEILKEPSVVRFAVIILALLAMILGPISGSATARVMDATNPSITTTATSACDQGAHAGFSKLSSDQDHCTDGGGACMDANGCRHLGCLTGGPVSGTVVHVLKPPVLAVPFADSDRPDGLNVAPLFDPPRRHA